MAVEQQWPDALWLVRHGESAGNVAWAAAVKAQSHLIDIPTRDCDVPLSDLGRRQASTLGAWFAQLPAEQRPGVVLHSPYMRAHETAKLVVAAGKLDHDNLVMAVDERLRERELGILDRLTNAGVAHKYPEQEELRRLLGKFYFRPPGGESWCDVILRLRSVIDTVTRDYSGERVMIVCHSVVVLCMRYLLEQMNEAQVLEIDRTDEVANCSVTNYVYDPQVGKRGGMTLERYNFVAPLEEAGQPITSDPDAHVAAR